MEENEHLTDMMISIIRSKNVGNETVALAAEVIAADARYNSRIAGFKSAGLLKEDRVLQFLEIIESVEETCRAAVRIVNANGNRKSVAQVLVDQKNLAEVLAEAKKQLDGAAR